MCWTLLTSFAQAVTGVTVPLDADGIRLATSVISCSQCWTSRNRSSLDWAVPSTSRFSSVYSVPETGPCSFLPYLYLLPIHLSRLCINSTDEKAPSNICCTQQLPCAVICAHWAPVCPDVWSHPVGTALNTGCSALTSREILFKCIPLKEDCSWKICLIGREIVLPALLAPCV